MIKEVVYKGYAAQPNEYVSEDGELAMAMNLVPEDGGLKGIKEGVVEMDIEEGYRLLYIHETPGGEKNYIFEKENSLYWKQSTESFKPLNWEIKDCEIYQVLVVGNTLIALTSEGRYYWLWQTNNYNELGSEFPELELSFGLKLELEDIKDGDSRSFVFPNEVRRESFTGYIGQDNYNSLMSSIWGEFDKWRVGVRGEGKFTNPFFVRYAYRLYDGSLSHQSAPIFMPATSGENPIVQIFSVLYDEESITAIHYYNNCASVTLDYKANDINNTLKKWGDIIKSVDIFVSQELEVTDRDLTKLVESKDWVLDVTDELIRGYRTDGTLVRTAEYEGFEGKFCVCRFTNPESKYDNNRLSTGVQLSTDKIKEKYQKWDYTNLFFARKIFGYEENGTIKVKVLKELVKFPRYSKEQYEEQIRDAGLFYLYKSIPIEKLAIGERTDILAEGVLLNLFTREVMTDDYRSHDKLVAKNGMVYNSRLSLTQVRQKLYNGYPGRSMLVHTDGYYDVLSSNPEEHNYALNINAWVYIVEDGKEICVQNEELAMTMSIIGYGSRPLYWFYPNINAKKVRIAIYENGLLKSCGDYAMEPHNMLNGAVAFKGWDGLYGGDMVIGTPSADATIANTNKIYTSDVDNPFIFPAIGVKTMAAGEIKGIASNTKALSQGQFGQFPLYAFTSEGVWAMTVSEDGTYNPAQPISRDVCVDAGSIAQIDKGVLFATARGVMLVSGSDVVSITDDINSEEPFKLANSVGGIELMRLSGITEHAFDIQPFMEFLDGVKTVYDYRHQRIFLYNGRYDYSYVYSLKTRRWGMSAVNLSYNVNSYPEALVVTKDNKLVNLSEEGDEKPGLMITQALKLDGGDILKTIDTIIQRGDFDRGDVSTVLWGSRDLKHWHMVWSSKDHYLRGFRGTPYKYFRIGALVNLKGEEMIRGASVQYELRETNKLR